MSADGLAVSARGLWRTYGSGPTETHALAGVDLDIPAGQLVALLGPSGSGKTTLLNLLGGIDRPTAGTVTVGGIDLAGLDTDGLTSFRRTAVGFVFQFFNLVATLTALENVELVAELAGHGHDRAVRALTDVGLGDKLDAFPSQLSGGQQQRVAIARAMAKETPVLLCDEPTGALDHVTGRGVLALLREACERHGRTVVVVSHDPDVAAIADRVLHLVDGTIADDRRNEHPLHPDELSEVG